MTGEHLITTPPTITVCGRCHAPVLAAVITGLERHVDPAALNIDGQLHAATHGVPLFLLRGSTLYRLTAEHVRADPDGTVLAEHTHHAIPDRFIDPGYMSAAIQLVTRLLGATPVAAEANDAPPF